MANNDALEFGPNVKKLFTLSSSLCSGLQIDLNATQIIFLWNHWDDCKYEMKWDMPTA